MKSLKLELSSKTQNYDKVTELVKSLVSYLNLNEAKQEDVRCAITEALTNAILYAYPNEEGIVSLEMKFRPNNTLEVKIQDKGEGIEDVKQAMEVFYTTGDSEEHSGMGFTVMEAFSDKLKVNSEPGKGTTIKLKFNL